MSENLEPITGLSQSTRVSGSPVVLVGMVWVPILTVTNVQRMTRITGIKIVLAGPAPTSPVYRFTAKRQGDSTYRAIAPYDPDGQDLVDGRVDALVNPLHIPKGASYQVEVMAAMAPGSPTAAVEFLNLVEFLP